MREIKFRGKRKDNGEWVYGYLIIDEGRYYICLEINEHIKRDDYEVYMIEVIPETVGQYTGLHDKNGIEIYEGDIVEIDSEMLIVKFHDGCFLLVNKFDEHFEEAKVLYKYMPFEIKKIGDIHDNPELIK